LCQRRQEFKDQTALQQFLKVLLPDALAFALLMHSGSQAVMIFCPKENCINLIRLRCGYWSFHNAHVLHPLIFGGSKCTNLTNLMQGRVGEEKTNESQKVIICFFAKCL
jgi:hypothetical protein